MAVAPCFQELFSNLITELKGLDKVKEVSSHFGPQQSLEDMFSYIWGLEEAHRCLKPTIFNSGKSDTEAERLRTEGNKHYQKKYLDKALDFYNISIMSAPHPRFSVVSGDLPGESSYEKILNIKSQNLAEVFDRSNENAYRSLALGYANRSAVLFELGQYEDCIKDIDMALRYGYPKLLHSKLAERKAKCLIAQKKETEAEELLNSSLEALNALSLDEAKSKASRDSLHQLLHQCRQGEGSAQPSQESKFNDVPSDLSGSREKLLFCYETPKPPELSHRNSVIPSLSSTVRLAFSPSQGRYLVAERDIKPGKLLWYSHIFSYDLMF